MWYFEASYYDYVEMETKARRIVFEASPYREHEAYIHAMYEALDMRGDTETLESLEFIAN